MLDGEKVKIDRKRSEEGIIPHLRNITSEVSWLISGRNEGTERLKR